MNRLDQNDFSDPGINDLVGIRGENALNWRRGAAVHACLS
jgi:hypothetical protein